MTDKPIVPEAVVDKMMKTLDSAIADMSRQGLTGISFDTIPLNGRIWKLRLASRKATRKEKEAAKK